MLEDIEPILAHSNFEKLEGWHCNYCGANHLEVPVLEKYKDIYPFRKERMSHECWCPLAKAYGLPIKKGLNNEIKNN